MARQLRVALLDDYQDVARRVVDWDRPGIEAVSFTTPVGDADELVAALRDFDVVVAMRERTPFPGDLLERLPRLRLLVTTGSRNAMIDVTAARRLGIVVCGTEGMVSPTVELTWGLILATVRRIPEEDAGIRLGSWQHTLGDSLEGRTLGLLGLGRIGARVASIGQAFGATCIAWSQNLTRDHAAGLGVEAVSRRSLFERGDVVSVHLRLSDRTRGLVGAEELDQLGPRGYLVNTSRAGIIDTDALLAALQAGRIAGAGLDVHDDEPLAVDHPIRSAPSTVLTPHLGYVTRQNYELFYRQALEDVEAFLDGAPIRVVPPG